MKNKTKATVLTFIISVINTIVTMIFGLVYNNRIISVYGSSINGLISTLTQFVTLFSVLEGGYTTAAIVASYSSFINGNKIKINNILCTAKKYLLHIGLIISTVALFIGVFYIRFINSPLNYLNTLILLILTIINTCGSICLIAKYTVLLQGNNQEYIQVIFSLISRLVTWIISIELIENRINVIIVYSLNVLCIFMNVLLLAYYKKKKYRDVTFKGTYNIDLIKGTKDVMFQKIANTVFTSTDLVLISLFVNLSYASVYNLYYTVYKTISNLVFSFMQAPFNSFGQLYYENGNNRKFINMFNMYNTISIIISNIFLLITSHMILPFISLYTKNINDFNYFYPYLVLVFYTQIFVQAINRPYGTVLNATGNFKSQNLQCGLSAIVNIIMSLLLVKKIGIYGIAIGTMFGMLIIAIMNIYQCNRILTLENQKKHIFTIFVNYLLGMLSIVFVLENKINVISYAQLISICLLDGVVVSTIVIIANLVLNVGVFKDILIFVYERMKH